MVLKQVMTHNRDLLLLNITNDAELNDYGSSHGKVDPHGEVCKEHAQCDVGKEGGEADHVDVTV